MVDKKIVDYVKENLDKGFTEQAVKRRLKQAGWDEDDVQQAILKIKSEKNPVKNFKIWIVIGIIGVIFVISFFVLFFAFTNGDIKGIDKSSADNVGDEGKIGNTNSADNSIVNHLPAPSSSANTTNSTTVKHPGGGGGGGSSSGNTDAGETCTTEIGCFALNASACTPSGLNYVMILEDGYVRETQTVYLEIKGEDSGKCEFYVKIIEVTIESDEYESLYNALVDQTEEGKDGTCMFGNQDLKDLLKRWEQENYSGRNDFPSDICIGDVFKFM